MQEVIVDGQHMVEVPKHYVKRGTAGGDPAWWISDQPLAGYEVHPSFLLDGVEVPAFQYGKYQASLSGGKLQSVPGVMPTQSSAMALYPVRIGFTPMTRAPRFFSLPRPILIGLLS